MNDSLFGSATRKNIIYFVIVGFCFILILQLFSMQILEHPEYAVKSEENSIKPVYQTAPRGVFYDRNGNILVGNKPSFTIRITPADYNNRLDKYIEPVIGVNPGFISKLLKENSSYSKYIPIKIKKDADFKIIAWYEENASNLPGVDYVIETQRDYSFGVSGSHMFGYTKEIGIDLLRQKKKEYDMGDNIGYSGLEKTYEKFLKGIKGIRYIIVNAQQKTIGSYNNGINDKSAIKGYDLILSIDKNAQEVAEKSFEGKRGALVALDPNNGEILAFVSSPQFDLSDFATVTSTEVWNRLNNDPDKPLFNRATMSIYSPGSTYKLLAATAALEEGIITPDYKITCQGGFQFGDRFFKCLHVHGTVNVITAIEKSCNTFFYQLILKIGLKKWAEYSHKFGFGMKTGVDIPEESKGLVPDEEYYDKIFGKGRFPKGILVSLGIGQGELSVTPIQLAQYAAIFASYGKTAKPHFVKGLIKSVTHEFIPITPEYFDVGVSKKTFDIVREGMYDVVNRAGTATNIRLPNIEIAGKTGTAQNPHGKEHSIFIGFAPFNNPKIAIAVVVENAGYGSTAAAPIARDVIKAYLEGNSKKVNENETYRQLLSNLIINKN
ncbi:penicillin-binding protein 2 [Melioribacteraceae bacterium 4301-Me]|uniref:penicillin-binding protein 2 n=1 Tax=Pyranulibacter aquaticus TaxID=3163344 RepID=UPI0035981A1B